MHQYMLWESSWEKIIGLKTIHLIKTKKDTKSNDTF